MPDFDRIEQVKQLAVALHGAFCAIVPDSSISPLPPPARAPLADKLYALGVRVHPELATLQIGAPRGIPQMANWRPQLPTKRSLEDYLRYADPELANKFAAAKTPEQQAALREECRHKYGSIVADLPQKIADFKASQ